MVEKNIIAEKVTELLRSRILGGSTREISFDMPLGESGLGLDSLALVQFITSLEKTFNLELPEHIWTDREKFTPRHFVEFIYQLHPDKIVGGPETVRIQAADIKSADLLSSGNSNGKGLLGGVAWAASRLLHRTAQLIHNREIYYVLIYDLLQGTPRPYQPAVKIALRPINSNDHAALDGIWDGRRMHHKTAQFEKRLKMGYICLAAWHENKIIGLDWLSEAGDREPFTGLDIQTRPGSIYGFDLHEHPQFRGKGVGLTILGYSLAVARERGFKTQFAIVHSHNHQMLAAASQIFGFKKVGRIVTTRIFGRPHSVWEIEGQTGRGPVLML